MRRVLQVGCGLVTAAVLLAGCGSSPAATPATIIDAHPSINISVPLATGACEGNGTCYAAGTTGLDAAPTATVQATTSGTAWHEVPSPAAPSTLFSASSCWSNGCLFGGSNSAGDVLWLTVNSTVTAVSAPAGGHGVVAISCFAVKSCGVLDLGANGEGRLSTTANAGASWSAPVSLPPNSLPTPASLSCTSAQACVESGTSPSVGAFGVWLVTSNGGATWFVSAASSWRSIVQLNCTLTQCEALGVDGNGATWVIQSNNSGQSWKKAPTQPSSPPNGLACSSRRHCVAIGPSGASASWLAVLSGTTWANQNLRYAPDPLTSINCSPARCVAVSQNTVVTVR